LIFLKRQRLTGSSGIPGGGRKDVFSLDSSRRKAGCRARNLSPWQRPIVLTAGNEPKLAELFARAELERGSCAVSATFAASMDWVSSGENLGLRGTL
jgi:hypothetical protein